MIHISNRSSYVLYVHLNICQEHNHDIFSYLIVRPSTPTIQGTSPGSTTIQGSEGMALMLTCTSNGGYPQQSVVWYRRGATITLLTNCSRLHRHDATNDLYDATHTCTFTPTSIDDGTTFFCQSSYMDKPSLVASSEIQLMLNRE